MCLCLLFQILLRLSQISPSYGVGRDKRYSHLGRFFFFPQNIHYLFSLNLLNQNGEGCESEGQVENGMGRGFWYSFLS